MWNSWNGLDWKAVSNQEMLAMESQDLQKAVDYLRANPGLSSTQVRNNLRLPSAVVQAAAASEGYKFAPKGKGRSLKTSATLGEVKTPGFPLGSVDLVKNRPNRSVRDMLQVLRKDVVYRLEDLSQEFGFSADKIRKEAKAMDCLFFSKLADEWVPVVLHPETAKKNG